MSGNKRQSETNISHINQMLPQIESSTFCAFVWKTYCPDFVVN